MRNTSKTEMVNIARKNQVTHCIIDELLGRDSFLLLGHKDPDADCIASMVAFALLLSRIQKEVTVFLPDPVIEQLDYLLAICKFNDITVIQDYDAKLERDFSVLIILDTPKPSMLMVNERISGLLADPSVRKIELDHHLGADSRYAGDEDYCLVSQASSTCELFGYLCLKFAARQNPQDSDPEKVSNFFSRNIALAILTGIVGDSQMGRYLKTSRERWYYHIFSAVFDSLLKQKTNLGSRNMASMKDIYEVIQNLSKEERECFEEMEKFQQKSPSIYAICVEKEPSEELFHHYGNEVIVNVSKSAADKLSEESGKLGLVAYYDDPVLSDVVQFRLRRSARFTGVDLRAVLAELAITNGGGHPGAVGFRVKKAEVSSLRICAGELMAQVERILEHQL
jgi:nanoRNase/pAp phosphatase (c-di-AMP/oligoRNAs hydrolase)